MAPEIIEKFVKGQAELGNQDFIDATANN